MDAEIVTPMHCDTASERRRQGISDESSEKPSAWRVDRAIPIGVFLWFVLVVLWLTWAPFAAGPGAEHVRLQPPDNWREIIANLGLFAPIGALLGIHAENRRLAFPLVGVVLVTAVASLVIEVGQLHIAGRVASPYDVGLNSIGSGLAARAAVMCRRRAADRVLVGALAGITFCAVALTMISAAHSFRREFKLANWSPDYLIHTGNEVGGGRLFMGTVADATICAGPYPNGCTPAGASLDQRTRLVDLAHSFQRFEVSARVRSRTSEQTGPARLVTFSLGPSLRNVTLAQQNNTLVLRVRTPFTGPNGISPEFHLPDAVRPNVLTRVAAEFRERTVTLRAEGDLVRKATFRFSPLNSWVLSHPVAALEPRHLSAATVLGAAVLLFPVALGLGYVVHRPFTATVYVVVVTVWVVTSHLWMRSGLDLPAIGATLGFVGLGLILGRRDRGILGASSLRRP